MSSKYNHKVLDYYIKSAQSGNSNAQICMSELYYTGSGVQKDKKQSIAWIQFYLNYNHNFNLRETHSRSIYDGWYKKLKLHWKIVKK